MGHNAVALYIVDIRAFVHRSDRHCLKVDFLQRRIPVSLNQCMVYKLPACPDCWPDVADFRQLVFGRGPLALKP